MSTVDIKLSLEEVSVLLGTIGQPGIAKSLLAANLGDINPDEERGRLLAANHTLMAKDILSLKNGDVVLQTEIGDIISSLVKQLFLLRFSRVDTDTEQILAFYYQSDHMVEHQIYDGVIHHFRRYTDNEAVFSTGVSFLDLDDANTFNCAEKKLPQKLFETIRVNASESLNKGKQLLREANVPEETVRLLSEDLHSDVNRGTVLRVEEDDQGNPVSNQGCLTLKGQSGRAWIFDILIEDDVPFINIIPFSRTKLYDKLQTLVK